MRALFVVIDSLLALSVVWWIAAAILSCWSPSRRQCRSPVVAMIATSCTRITEPSTSAYRERPCLYLVFSTLSAVILMADHHFPALCASHLTPAQLPVLSSRGPLRPWTVAPNASCSCPTPRPRAGATPRRPQNRAAGGRPRVLKFRCSRPERGRSECRLSRSWPRRSMSRRASKPHQPPGLPVSTLRSKGRAPVLAATLEKIGTIGSGRKRRRGDGA